jgi:pimeloyl-ACP methyl ester carboxylesterase
LGDVGISGVVCPDLPGFGARSVLEVESSVEALADDLAQWLKNRGMSRVILGGFSMGGYVALAFAERHPQMLGALALISTQAAADSPARRRLRRILIAAVQRRGVEAALGENAELLFALGHREDLELRRKTAVAARKSSVAGVCWCLEAMARRVDRVAVLPRLNCPVLVAHGLEDQYIPVDCARKMAALLSRGSLVEIPGCGHSLPWEGSRALALALAAWMAKAQKDFKNAQSSL